MKRQLTVGFVVLIAGLATSACSNHSSDHAQSFDGFVENLIQGTADDTEPVAVNGHDFAFSEDENAFDDLFP